jgi:transcriptional regulator with GAF, ATPase, and Fis domain
MTMSMTNFVGESRQFQNLLNEIEVIAPVDCTVLIQGETGTGKEVVAHAIHEGSRRRQNNFVPINCAAIPAALLESELFGHERGAFTGAISPRVGRFQAADRGTLFLDEIGELPLELQPKLLRVLQEHQLERLGSSQSVPVDVRVIAATNQDLWGMVQERKFRADLYYRLDVCPIHLPPLRDRRGDLPLLVSHFVRTFAERHGKSVELVSDEVMRAFETYDWPGNIRQLQNVIERAVIMSPGLELRLSLADLTKRLVPTTLVRTLADADRAHIIATLRETNGVVGGRNGAAAKLGLPRTTLLARMEKLGLLRSAAPATPDRADVFTQAGPSHVAHAHV